MGIYYFTVAFTVVTGVIILLVICRGRKAKEFSAAYSISALAILLLIDIVCKWVCGNELSKYLLIYVIILQLYISTSVNTLIKM